MALDVAPRQRQLGRALLPLAMMFLTVGVSAAVVGPFLSLFLSTAVHASPVQTTVFLTTTPLAGVAVSTLLGGLSDRRPIRRKLLILASVAGLVGSALTAAIRDYWLLLGLALTATALTRLLFPQTFAYARQILSGEDPSRAALRISALRTVFSAAWVAGPPVAAFLLDKGGFTLVYGTAAAMYGIAALVGIFFLDELQPPAAAGASVSSADDDLDGVDGSAGTGGPAAAGDAGGTGGPAAVDDPAGTDEPAVISVAPRGGADAEATAGAALPVAAGGLVAPAQPAAPQGAGGPVGRTGPGQSASAEPPVWVLWASSFAFMLLQCPMTLGVQALPLFVSTDLHGEVGDAGMVLGLCAALEIPLMLGLGALTARIRLRTLVLLGAGCGALYYSLATVASGVAMLLFAQLINATFIAAVTGLGISYMQELLPLQPGRATTLFTNSFPIGAMLAGPLLGLAQHFGYRLAYGLSASLCAVGLLVLVVIHPARAVRGRPPLTPHRVGPR